VPGLLEEPFPAQVSSTTPIRVEKPSFGIAEMVLATVEMVLATVEMVS